MIYYHGTPDSFRKFDLNKASDYKDFGKGIYLSQEEWHATSIAKRRNKDHAYVMKYDIDIKEMRKVLKVREFKKMSIDWIKFVLLNRNQIIHTEYDVIIGGTADAAAQSILEQFYRFWRNRGGNIGRKQYRELIVQLAPNKYPIQMCLLTQKAVDYVNDRYIDREDKNGK